MASYISLSSGQTTALLRFMEDYLPGLEDTCDKYGFDDGVRLHKLKRRLIQKDDYEEDDDDLDGDD